jgi:hypothetical protein
VASVVASGFEAGHGFEATAKKEQEHECEVVHGFEATAKKEQEHECEAGHGFEATAQKEHECTDQSVATTLL